uniref:Uncharacterized protein n=1 Tax=Rhizophora mucronata TaxID=61149 RepID=A0A2P2NLX0_RHIMU
MLLLLHLGSSGVQLSTTIGYHSSFLRNSDICPNLVT